MKNKTRWRKTDYMKLLKKHWSLMDGKSHTTPYQMKDYDPDWEVDFGAEKVIAAERGAEKIAVELKSFLETSFAHEFHSILGQYLDYLSGLKRIEPERKLYLAVPIEIWETEFQRVGITNSLNDYKVKLIIYDPVLKNILQWLT